LTYEPYVWSKSLSRAARHVLHDQGACSTSGDIYSMSYSQVLSAYYAWSYLGLEFKQFDSDYFINWNNTDESPEKALYYLLSQESFDLSIFGYQKRKEIGIGCACSPKPGHPYNYACIIAIAD